MNLGVILAFSLSPNKVIEKKEGGKKGGIKKVGYPAR